MTSRLASEVAERAVLPTLAAEVRTNGGLIAARRHDTRHSAGPDACRLDAADEVVDRLAGGEALSISPPERADQANLLARPKCGQRLAQHSVSSANAAR